MRYINPLPRALTGGLIIAAVLSSLGFFSSIAMALPRAATAGHPPTFGLPGRAVATVTPVAPAGPAPTCQPAKSAACAPQKVLYSHSWYITHPDEMASLGQQDAHWLNQESAKSGCRGSFLTILDFGHPSTKYSGNASPLDNYAMSLYGHQSTYRQVEQFAERYLDAWHAAANRCPQLRLALGTSNYAECVAAVGACSVSTAGQQWDAVVHDVMGYVTAKGYSHQVTDVWVADDLEGSWDPWPTTLTFLHGVQAQERTYTTHAHLVDYGDADAGACSEVTGACNQPWSTEDVYAAAWSVGWDLPLPEIYSTGTSHRWETVTRSVGKMAYLGAITECSGAESIADRGMLGGGRLERLVPVESSDEQWMGGGAGCPSAHCLRHQHPLARPAGHTSKLLTSRLDDPGASDRQ